MWSSVILLTVFALLTSAQNDFDAIQGCKQYTISRPSYNSPNPYYALDQFQDLQQVEVAGLKIRSIKIAVIGSNDGVIRLSPVEQPYQNTLMDEIVLSGWGNTRNAVRQYVRSSPSRYTRAVILANQLSGGILSPYKPFVFTLSIVNDHLVALSKNGESLPFLQYTDVGVTPKYIGFSNWNAPVSVFYDSILGCKQYTITGPSYKNPNPYFALDEFQNVLDVEVAGLKIRTIRPGVMGSNDGVIRLAPVVEPYQNTLMEEIVLSGWKNTRNAVRHGTSFIHYRGFRCIHYSGTGYNNYRGIHSICSA
ncbi:hypothetical protein pipiens_015755 [Culex pipiens pipiens]|uniref:Farnesoic acid O-methyl transferase domain-containing protein n=1 Tax=Culex pipiens pipiens TaxID=38569 RepID=A0ABD1CP80_CULPP